MASPVVSLTCTFCSLFCKSFIFERNTTPTMFNKEEAFNKISELVERFDDQKEFYKKSDYNETLTRKDYIDPFFEALGWDMNNKLGAWEAYREVIHEDRLKIAEQTKAPDYSFRLLGGQRLFFVEAKKPSIGVCRYCK